MVAIFSAADASVVVGLITLCGLVLNALWTRKAAQKSDQAAKQAQNTNVLARETAQQVQTPNAESLGNMVAMTSDLGLRNAGKLDALKTQVGGVGEHVDELHGKVAQVEEKMTEHIKRQEPLEERFLEQNPDLRPKEE